MLCRPVFAMPMPNFEAIRQFLVTKLSNKPQKLHMIKIVIAFFRSSRPSTKKNTTVEFAVKTESDRHQFCLKRPTSKFDLV